VVHQLDQLDRSQLIHKGLFSNMDQACGMASIGPHIPNILHTGIHRSFTTYTASVHRRMDARSISQRTNKLHAIDDWVPQALDCMSESRRCS